MVDYTLGTFVMACVSSLAIYQTRSGLAIEHSIALDRVWPVYSDW